MTSEMGSQNEQTDSAYPNKRRMLIWIAVRITGIAAFLLATVLGLIGGLLGVALILAFLVGSNFALRLIAKLNLRSTLSYAIYVCSLLVLLALWFFSIISITWVIIALVPLALGYLVLSYSGRLR